MVSLTNRPEYTIPTHNLGFLIACFYSPWPVSVQVVGFLYQACKEPGYAMTRMRLPRANITKPGLFTPYSIKFMANKNRMKCCILQPAFKDPGPKQQHNQKLCAGSILVSVRIFL